MGKYETCQLNRYRFCTFSVHLQNGTQNKLVLEVLHWHQKVSGISPQKTEGKTLKSWAPNLGTEPLHGARRTMHNFWPNGLFRSPCTLAEAEQIDSLVYFLPHAKFTCLFPRFLTIGFGVALVNSGYVWSTMGRGSTKTNVGACANLCACDAHGRCSFFPDRWFETLEQCPKTWCIGSSVRFASSGQLFAVHNGHQTLHLPSIMAPRSLNPVL